ncbi:ketopantoate reductase family protein [Shewanella sp. UCD-KL12]|uniref:ketopantoate reductase family protein n=1 Tax=Shewanella sp. UCD-KL12 TaxID=1917163 RepID=UPI0009713B99|nr:2-dehydropantoate 2-reductase [Shewanella sp. UCD-KL12]
MSKGQLEYPTDNASIAILGAGAIGQLIYHQLAQTGSAPYFISKSPSQALQTLTFQPLAGKLQQSQAQLINLATADLNESEQVLTQQTGLLIVCVKAYQVYGALKGVIDKLPKRCHVLLLHNGMGPHLEVESLLSGRGLSLGTTSQGALREADWYLKQTGSGLTQIGVLCKPLLSPELKQRLSHAIPNCEWCEPILPYLWQKLAINAAINPLTAIEQCPNGALAAPKYQQTINEVINELVEVALATGVKLDKLALTNRVHDVIALTSKNFSSMHQDIANERLTEIDSINGYVVKIATGFGIEVPANQQLLTQVKRLESKYR